jgi:AcrR family transcriptional regulator
MAETSHTLRQRLRDTAAEALLDSAEQVMVEKGYEGATMQDIAAAAGCATGTFYSYFKNKEDLFQAIVFRHMRTLVEQMHQAAGTTDEPLEKLRLHSTVFIAYANAHRPFFNLFCNCMPLRHAQLMQRVGEPTRAEHDAFHEYEIDLVRQAQQAGKVRSDLEAPVILELMDGLTMVMLDRCLCSAQPPSPEQQVEWLWGFISKGIQGQPAERRQP